jgi:hypothetical protein
MIDCILTVSSQPSVTNKANLLGGNEVFKSPTADGKPYVIGVSKSSNALLNVIYRWYYQLLTSVAQTGNL